MRVYVNDYQKIDSNENAKISINRLDEQITNIHAGIDSFQTIQESVSQAIGMVAGLVSVSAPSGVPITSNYERLGQKASNLKDEVGECEYNHLISDFGNMEDMLSNISQIINRQSGKSNVTISTYQAGSISKVSVYQKLQEAASATQSIDLEGSTKESKDVIAGWTIMREEWIKIIPQITDNLEDLQQIECPNCGKHGINYVYIGDERTRIGYLQIWCSECLKGIYVSRVVAPINAKFVSFDGDLKGIIPKYEFVED